jgi:hypothetical protein
VTLKPSPLVFPLAGWISPRQQIVIGYLTAETRMIFVGQAW